MSIIEKNGKLINEILDRKTIESERVLKICHQLAVTTDKLNALLSQANAQFKAGDSHATFNKQIIEACS